MTDTKTIRIYEADWARLADWQASRAKRTRETPSFADLIQEALDLAKTWAGDMP